MSDDNTIMTTSTQKVSDLRIVLLGKSGSGKSATGNTILGKKAFEDVDFMKSAGKLCEKQEKVVGGKTISVFDTPGLFNTAVTKHQLKAEIQKCILMSFPGPHVFLLVLKLGVRFTKEERDTVKWIQENFGDEALCRTIILFTHADQLKGKPLDEYINKSDHLLETVNSCGGRYHSFNNEDRNNQDQVTELLKKIDAMMEENEMSHYTLEMFQTTQKMKEGKTVKIACGIAVLGIGILGTVKIAGMISTAISGSAAGAAVETAVAATGEAAEAVDKVLAAIEKSVETVKKAVETAVEAATNKAVGVIGEAAREAMKTVAEKVVETTGEAVQTSATGTGLAAQGVVTGLAAAAASAGAARAAAAAGKVATSGRVSAVAALAAAFGAAAVTLISALKR